MHGDSLWWRLPAREAFRSVSRGCLLITVIVAEESEASSKAFAGKRKKIATRANVERTRDPILDESGNSGSCSAASRFDAGEQRRRDCR